MAKPDIELGPGDTAPITRLTLYDPDLPDGTPGPPMNLQNGNTVGSSFKSVVCKHQVRDWSLAPVLRTVIIRQTAPPSAPGLSDGVNQGVIDIDWLASGGPVVPAPSDHNLRLIVTDNAGYQQTSPNGEDCPQPDGTNPAFLWLHVARDFVPVVTPPPTPVKLSGWFTVDTVGALKAVVSALYLAGSTFFVVRESNRAARLDGTSGLIEDLNNGPFATPDDPTLQWFYF